MSLSESSENRPHSKGSQKRHKPSENALQENPLRGCRAGSGVGGASLDPSALAGLPGMKRLQPLLPETRNRNCCSFSSMHSPIVRFSTEAFGSICHHLQSLHNPPLLV